MQPCSPRRRVRIRFGSDGSLVYLGSPQQQPAAGDQGLGAAGALRAFLRLAPAAADTLASFSAMQAFWRAAPGLRRHVRAASLSGSTLRLFCADPETARFVSAAPELLRRVQAQQGGGPVRRLECRVGSIEELPTWEEPPRPARAARRATAAPPDPEVLLELVEVDDPELRDRLAALYQRSREVAAPLGLAGGAPCS